MLTYLRSLKRGHALKTPDHEALTLTKAKTSTQRDELLSRMLHKPR